MIVATGAGASSQIAIGTSVFYGMIAATFIGIILFRRCLPCLKALRNGQGTDVMKLKSKSKPRPAATRSVSGWNRRFRLRAKTRRRKTAAKTEAKK